MRGDVLGRHTYTVPEALLPALEKRVVTVQLSDADGRAERRVRPADQSGSDVDDSTGSDVDDRTGSLVEESA